MFSYFKYLALALVVSLFSAQAYSNTCAREVIKQLRAELDQPTSVIPYQLKKLSDVASIITLGSGNKDYGGTSYLVTFYDGRKKVFKIYNYINSGSVDLDVMKRLMHEQEIGRDLGFKIPSFVQRRDLGPQVMELEYIEGISLYKLMTDSRVDPAIQERLIRIYSKKFEKFLEYFKTKYQAEVHINHNSIQLYMSGHGASRDLGFIIKSDNIIVTPSEEMYFIDPY